MDQFVLCFTGMDFDIEQSMACLAPGCCLHVLEYFLLESSVPRIWSMAAPQARRVCETLLQKERYVHWNEQFFMRKRVTIAGISAVRNHGTKWSVLRPFERFLSMFHMGLFLCRVLVATAGLERFVSLFDSRGSLAFPRCMSNSERMISK